MKKLKVVETLQYNGVNMKVISTKRTTVKMGLIYCNAVVSPISFCKLNTYIPWHLNKVIIISSSTLKQACSLTSIWGSWIINEFENLSKRGSALGKQNLRVNCPTGKVEFKYFSSPEKLFLLPRNGQGKDFYDLNFFLSM